MQPVMFKVFGYLFGVWLNAAGVGALATLVYYPVLYTWVTQGSVCSSVQTYRQCAGLAWLQFAIWLLLPIAILLTIALIWSLVKTFKKTCHLHRRTVRSPHCAGGHLADHCRWQ
ncbi:hypothetical protein DO97_05655 [Neosynechococcus sphagnicola sy1]|uniref:Uncharacterized protein n=1 Tax=Neosynechococcus sphagnicola sy1 TaxID=1497020 RepID=A0A098TNF6_9CYAN|nr:hypothetical protein [Neosynechococcus sphagnicola]KGF73860.1 hypothetical protein DO97_05655 [Neosynechococcus sphagnicola sy1]